MFGLKRVLILNLGSLKRSGIKKYFFTIFVDEKKYWTKLKKRKMGIKV
jgi:hypothetical protein